MDCSDVFNSKPMEISEYAPFKYSRGVKNPLPPGSNLYLLKDVLENLNSVLSRLITENDFQSIDWEQILLVLNFFEFDKGF